MDIKTPFGTALGMCDNCGRLLYLGSTRYYVRFRHNAYMFCSRCVMVVKPQPDCEHAEHDGTGCLGYCGCAQDDEPIESCKRREQYTGNISGEW